MEDLSFLKGLGGGEKSGEGSEPSSGTRTVPESEETKVRAPSDESSEDRVSPEEAEKFPGVAEEGLSGEPPEKQQDSAHEDQGASEVLSGFWEGEGLSGEPSEDGELRESVDSGSEPFRESTGGFLGRIKESLGFFKEKAQDLPFDAAFPAKKLAVAAGGLILVVIAVFVFFLHQTEKAQERAFQALSTAVKRSTVPQPKVPSMQIAVRQARNKGGVKEPATSGATRAPAAKVSSSLSGEKSPSPEKGKVEPRVARKHSSEDELAAKLARALAMERRIKQMSEPTAPLKKPARAQTKVSSQVEALLSQVAAKMVSVDPGGSLDLDYVRNMSWEDLMKMQALLAMVLRLEEIRAKIVSTRISTLREQLELAKDLKNFKKPSRSAQVLNGVKVLSRLSFGKEASGREAPPRKKPEKRGFSSRSPSKGSLVVRPAFRVAACAGDYVVLSDGTVLAEGEAANGFVFFGIEDGRALFRSALTGRMLGLPCPGAHSALKAAFGSPGASGFSRPPVLNHEHAT